jgi:hypothetical protein
MELAKAFGYLRFVVRDRVVVVDMGVKVRLFPPFFSFVCARVCAFLLFIIKNFGICPVIMKDKG